MEIFCTGQYLYSNVLLMLKVLKLPGRHVKPDPSELQQLFHVGFNKRFL